MTPASRRLRRCVLRVAIVAFGVPGIACTESTKPADVVPFDAEVQPVLTATSTVKGAAGSEVVHIVVGLTNPDGRPRRYTIAQQCPLGLRLFTTPDRTGTPVYQDWTPPRGCKSSIVADTLAAHASITLASDSYPVVYSPSAPNGQQLPPGRYYGAVRVGINELTSATSTLPVGEIVLVAP